MKCSFCGNEVEEGAKFCSVCGTEIKAENGSGEEQSAAQYGDPNGQNSYEYGQPNNGQSEYSYNQPNNGQQEYNYNQSSNGQQEYSYNQMNNGPQGNYYGQPNYGQPVKQINGTPYLIFSILTTICCCLPLGIASIVYATKINSLQKMGDYAGAEAAAKKAKIFMIVGAIGGLIGSVGLGALGAFDKFDDYGVGASIVSDESDDKYEDDADDEEKDGAPSKKVEASGDLGDSWKSFSVQINDTVLTFPCTVEEVEAVGLKMDTEGTPEDYVINKDDYELVFFEDDKDNSIMFMVCNNLEEAHTVRECTVNGIYVDDYDVEDGNLTIIFPGGIQIGTDIETVIEKWGEPDDTYEGDYSDSYSWYDQDNYNYCTLNVDPDTNEVTVVDLDGQDL